MSEYSISVIRSTYTENDPEDPLGGGAVNISCDCGFDGYVDCDDNGWEIMGECEQCYTPFCQLMV